MNAIQRATRTLSVLAVLSAALLHSEPAEAVKYMNLKEALKHFMPTGAKLSKVNKTLSAEELKKARDRFGLKDKTDYKDVLKASNEIYLMRDKDGKVQVYVFIMEQYWRTCYHKFAVGVSSSGSIIEVKPMELPCPYQRPIAKESFLKQFKGKQIKRGGPVPANLGKDIDAVSGATASSEVTAIVARRALALYEVFFAN